MQANEGAFVMRDSIFRRMLVDLIGMEKLTTPAGRRANCHTITKKVAGW